MIINQSSGKENLDEILTAQDNLISQILSELDGKKIVNKDGVDLTQITVKATSDRVVEVYDKATHEWVAVTTNGVKVAVSDHLLVRNSVRLLTSASPYIRFLALALTTFVIITDIFKVSSTFFIF